MSPTPRTYEPRWLAPDDVKSWLALHNQDTADDANIVAACAMTEPYVARCRPEWTVPIVAEAVLRLDSDYYSTETVIRVDEWQAAHPESVGGLVDQRGHVVMLRNDPADDWGAADPNAVVLVMFTDAEGARDVWPLVAAGATSNPVTVREAVAWMTQRRPFVLQAVGDTHFTARTDLATYAPDAETYRVAVMYAAREYRRRNSPAGIETFGETTSFVSRYDPDIDRGLQTGAYARPVVA